jgi:hypothetical protein
MNINNKNFLFDLLKNKLKTNLSKYTFDQLKKIINDFIKNIEIYKSIYSIDIIEKININTFDNFDDCNKLKLENIINNLWEEFPIVNDSNEIIDCAICLSNVNNNDNIVFQCNHILHSTCFLNYLFTNFKSIQQKTNNYNNDNMLNNKITNLFRCPNCRNYLTPFIKNINNDIQLNNNIQLNNEELNNEHEYDDEYNNFILQEYTIYADTLDNSILNNFLNYQSNNINMNSIGESDSDLSNN